MIKASSLSPRKYEGGTTNTHCETKYFVGFSVDVNQAIECYFTIPVRKFDVFSTEDETRPSDVVILELEKIFFRNLLKTSVLVFELVMQTFRQINGGDIHVSLKVEVGMNVTRASGARRL